MNRNIRMRALWLALCALFVGVTFAVAQEVAPAAADFAANSEKMTLTDVIRSARWPLYVLAGMSVLGVGFVVYFLIVLRFEQVAPRALRRELLNKINSGLLEEARVSCEYRPCALSAITLSALDYMSAVQVVDPAMLKDVVESEGQRQAVSIQDQIQYLLDIAVISPMVGLFGTVLGMMTAFNSVATDIASARPMQLAGGVSQALITTAAGLLVGIPAMMFYAYFRGRCSRLISNIEVVAHDVLTALLRKSEG